MSGETDLEKLLQTLHPTLLEGEYVFCSVSEKSLALLDFSPLSTFREQEGVTMICLREEAEKAKLPYIFPSRLITLTVHSGLEAVGLTAAVSKKLASAGISANVVAAYYHDHIFVPSDRAEEAIQLLGQF